MPARIKIDMKDIKQLERDLGAFKAKALPFATRNTLNVAAFQTQDVSKKRIRNRLVLRNRFTLQSVRVNQTKTLRISRQAAFVGSTADYMEDQEFGTIIPKKGKHGIPIPTSFSAGQGEKTQPRTRLPKGPNRFGRLHLGTVRRKRPKGQPKHRKQALLFKVQDAVLSGKRSFFHDFKGGKKTGLFKVRGGRKNFKRGWPKGAQLKMLYSLESKSVRVPARPWLKPSVDVVRKRMLKIHRKSLVFQLKKHGLFKG